MTIETESTDGLQGDTDQMVRRGDLILIAGRWYITHSGLLRIAKSKRCCGIHADVVAALSDPHQNRWVVKATVRKTARATFGGFGDADPSNVSDLVRGAELRVAETRAVNRALRKAYGIGMCSVDEIGAAAPDAVAPLSNASSRTQAPGRLCDQLRLAIRRFRLDPNLVKRYALSFCGAVTLKDAGPEKVAEFIQHLTHLATVDRDQLLAAMAATESASEEVA
jgi:hypothetical protein